MSDIVPLKAKNREDFGTGATRQFRRENMIPAVIYSKDKENKHINVFLNEITRVIVVEGGFKKRPVELTFEDGSKITVKLKDAQFHPIKDRPIHLDFMYL